jgi:tRNA pseudouridine32 synthase/23S rRNA pseudouridine746 synthase
MATSGLVLMARSPVVQRALGEAFAKQEVSKRYEAVVDGTMPESPDWSTIDAPIAADWPRRPMQKIDPAGKPSITRWRALESNLQDATRLLLEPQTGRTHQLRVHLAFIGHPILGDALYAGDSARNRSERLLLHAAALQFKHPVTGAAMRFESAASF